MCRADIGANPLTDGQGEGGDLDDKVELDYDVVIAFRLHDTAMKPQHRKAHYIPHIKGANIQTGLV